MKFRPLLPPSWLAKLAALMLLAGLSPLAPAAETNVSPKHPVSEVRPVAVSPQEQVAAHERAGRKREAAVLYEDLARTNTVARKVVAGRLVKIYAETGETNKALAWAQEVMRDNPDPQAYLAAVHMRLRQHKEAEKILEQEIATNTNATRSVTLRWQLAEVCEAGGDRQSARKHLAEAVQTAKGTPMETTAQKRWEAMK